MRAVPPLPDPNLMQDVGRLNPFTVPIVAALIGELVFVFVVFTFAVGMGQRAPEWVGVLGGLAIWASAIWTGCFISWLIWRDS